MLRKLLGLATWTLSALCGSAAAKDVQLRGVDKGGAVLPENVYRVQAMPFVGSASGGFNKAGKRTNDGFQVRKSGVVTVIEAGITSKLSLQVLVPGVVQSSLGLNQNKFIKSARYKQEYAKVRGKVAKGLVGQGLCKTRSECEDLIEGGFEAVPFEEKVDGNTFKHSGGMLKDSIRDAVLHAATPPGQEQTGLGDLEVGALYNFYASENLIFSAGLGFRFPTGYQEVTDLNLPLSRGLYDAGLRLNLDAHLGLGFWVSAQEKLELALSRAAKRQSSLAEPAEFADAPKQTYGKRGVDSEFIGKLSYGFGALYPSLNGFGVYGNYSHHLGRAEYLNGEIWREGESVHAVGGGVMFSALPYEIPLEVDLSHQRPVAGVDSLFAADRWLLKAKLYFRI